MICYSEANGLGSDFKRSMRMSIAETLVAKLPLKAFQVAGAYQAPSRG